MPVYEFRCQDCDKTFEVSRAISETGAVSCPHCGSAKVERMWSRVFAITGKKS
jgi:putative FmdB family regulatory protein